MGQIQSTFWPRSNEEGGGEGKGEPPFSSLCLFNHDMYISCVTVIVLPVVLLVLADELKKINFESENFRSPFCQPSNPMRKN